MPKPSLQTYLGPGLQLVVPFGGLCLLDIVLKVQVPLTLLSWHSVLKSHSSTSSEIILL